MDMLMDPFPVAFEGSDVGLVAASALAAAPAAFDAGAGAAFRVPSGPSLAVAGCATTGRVAFGVGFSTELTPIVRAWVELASLVALSRICFCFSSSLAKIETRSSGIGLLSYERLSA